MASMSPCAKEDNMLRALLIRSVFAGVALVTTSMVQVQADEPIKIGLAIAKSGWMTAFDDDPSKALRIAVDDVNASGGILGRKIELLEEDTKTDPAQAFKVGTDLV